MSSFSRYFSFTVVILGLLTLSNYIFYRANHAVKLFIVLEDANQVTLKAYWNIGQGFGEAWTQTQQSGVYETQRMAFSLPPEIQSIRMDPDAGDGVVQIRDISIGQLPGLLSFSLPQAQMREGHQVAIDHFGPLSRVSLLEDKTDPYFFIDLTAPQIAKIENMPIRLKATLFALDVLILLIVGPLLLFYRRRFRSA